jgi:glutaminase
VQRGLSRFAGRELALDEEVYASAAATNHRNRAIAWLLHSLGAIAWDPIEATDVYTRQCCLTVTARDLATMAPRWPTAGSTRSPRSASSIRWSATTRWR